MTWITWQQKGYKWHWSLLFLLSNLLNCSPTHCYLVSTTTQKNNWNKFTKFSFMFYERFWLAHSVINPWGLIGWPVLTHTPGPSGPILRLKKRNWKRKACPPPFISFLGTTVAESIIKVHLWADITEHKTFLNYPRTCFLGQRQRDNPPLRSISWKLFYRII